MNHFQNQNILIGVSGGIAAYKTAQLVRELKKLGAHIKVVMTESATRFITPLTFSALSGQPVCTSLWEENAEHGMDHIQLARWADVFLIAPTTANLIAKLAHGLADNLLTTIALVTQAPLILCPAMNHSMYEHPATQHNLSLLQQRGVMIIEPESGEAACGETGVGRMCDVDHLIQVLRLYTLKGLLAGQSCVITAGPTHERIDPVRYISNDSSGKMGHALAYAAWMAGAKVTLITGPTAQPIPPGIQTIAVKTALEMGKAVESALSKDCLFIGAAAVADYRVATPETHKIKKTDATQLELALIKNPDILHLVTQSGLAKYVVGFAAETQNLIDFAQEKRIKKQLNLIIANQVGENLGFNQDVHAVTLLTDTVQLPLPSMHKVRLGGEIIRWIAMNMN
jgi:phosphopantothenoylcysteine decarboxylase/phosphopantothenate--cysteine ligase